jgi:hypothetical protein
MLAGNRFSEAEEEEGKKNEKKKNFCAFALQLLIPVAQKISKLSVFAIFPAIFVCASGPAGDARLNRQQLLPSLVPVLSQASSLHQHTHPASPCPNPAHHSFSSKLETMFSTALDAWAARSSWMCSKSQPGGCTAVSQLVMRVRNLLSLHPSSPSSHVFVFHVSLSLRSHARSAGKLIAREKMPEFLQQEGLVYQVLRAHPHPNIQLPTAIVEGADYCGVIFPSLSEDCHSYMRRSAPGLPEREARPLFRDIVSIVEHLHAHRIVLRDLRLGKFFLKNTARYAETWISSIAYAIARATPLKPFTFLTGHGCSLCTGLSALRKHVPMHICDSVGEKKMSFSRCRQGDCGAFRFRRRPGRIPHQSVSHRPQGQVRHACA